MCLGKSPVWRFFIIFSLIMNIHQKPELYSDNVIIAQNVTYPFPGS